MLVVATDQVEAPSGASPACAVPDGVAHAFDTDARRTRCGRTEVTVWPELTWPSQGMAAVDTCPDCEAASD